MPCFFMRRWRVAWKKLVIDISGFPLNGTAAP
jgi:hypothetical protein